MDVPFFSVITVVFNGEAEIVPTLNSIEEQSFNDFEYIVIDGDSTDSTIEIVNSHSLTVNVLVSEKDNGIYDAMNKGTQLATGKYIVFMNAGDCFSSSKTLESIHSYLSEMDVDLLAGSVEVLYPDDKAKIKVAISCKLNSKFMPVSHQSLFAKRDVLIKYPFSLKYKLASDFNFLMSAINDGYSFDLVPDVISKVSSGGVSDVKRIAVWNEYQSIHNSFNKKSILSDLYFTNKKLVEIIKKVVKAIIR